MDIISFNEAATANGRIEIINANPDSTSGIVTVPKVIASGETVTIPAGRVAVLPNVQVDGDLVVEAGGEIFVPAGANFGDLEAQIASKVSLNEDETIAGIKTFNSSPIVPIPTTGTQSANKDYVDTKQSKSKLAYDVDTSSYMPNTLASGAIIERGSNANGEYIKFADGTLICKGVRTLSFSNVNNIGVLVTFPATFVNNQYSFTHSAEDSDLGSFYYFYPAVPAGPNAVKTASQINIFLFSTAVANITATVSCNFMAIGRWK